MSDRINYQNNVITANKFVQVGGNSIGSKEKLNSIRNTIGTKKNEFDNIDIEYMLNDDIITPDEKIELKSRWMFISLAFSRLSDDILSAFGDEGMSGYSDMIYLRNEIDSMLSLLFANMHESTKPPSGLEGKITEFTIKYNELSQVYSSCMMEILKYEVSIRCDKSSYFDEDIVTVVPTVKYKGNPIVVPNEHISWSIDPQIEYGTNLDGSIFFRASEYDENASIRCDVSLDITTSLSS